MSDYQRPHGDAVPLPATVYATAPAGEVEITVKAATLGNVPWKRSDANPAGSCLQLRLSAGTAYGLVFEDLPVDKHKVAAVVAKSFGLTLDALVPEGLVGRTARVTLKHIDTRTGLRAVVDRWLPSVATDVAVPAAPTPPKRSTSSTTRPSRNAPPKTEQDDIGF